MNLKDFVKETIKNISEAINESNEELSSIGTIVNPKDVHPATKDQIDNIYGFLLGDDEDKNYRRPVHLVNFDVAVTSATTKDGEEGIGVNIAGIKLGKEGSSSIENNTSSRLKFSIPIAFPSKEN